MGCLLRGGWEGGLLCSRWMGVDGDNGVRFGYGVCAGGDGVYAGGGVTAECDRKRIWD